MLIIFLIKNTPNYFSLLLLFSMNNLIHLMVKNSLLDQY